VRVLTLVEKMEDMGKEQKSGCVSLAERAPSPAPVRASPRDRGSVQIAGDGGVLFDNVRGLDPRKILVLALMEVQT